MAFHISFEDATFRYKRLWQTREHASSKEAAAIPEYDSCYEKSGVWYCQNFLILEEKPETRNPVLVCILNGKPPNF